VVIAALHWQRRTFQEIAALHWLGNEGLFYRLQGVIGQIFGIATIANDKQLYILKQTVVALKGMFLIPVNLAKSFFNF
jgi:hypothetical protein